jgi:hypothetical protein
MNDVIYFQPPDINPKYCEAGILGINDEDYIWYLDEPCKVLISEVTIISNKDVVYNNKSRLYEVKQQENGN